MGQEEIWDVVVIGGGPAGMMAAGRAAELGAQVILLEKNESLGKKLLISGGSRCNLTNYEPDARKFLAKLKDSGKFLFSTFSKWDVEDTLNFFHQRGMETKIEPGNRVFPTSDKSESVWNVLLSYLKKGRVTVISNAPVIDLIKKDNRIEAIKLSNGKTVRAKTFILATGGKSHPETGSTGDGFVWLKKIGHTVITPSAALVPISVKDSWVKKLQGISLSDVKITVIQNNKKLVSKIGKILFTHFGLSGPGILNLSQTIGESLKYGPVELTLDLLPKVDQGSLNLKLRELFNKNSNKKLTNNLDSLIPSALIPIVVELSEINPQVFCHSVTKEERLRLVQTLKNLPIKVRGLLGVDKAIVTSGGVDLKEVDFKNMRSLKLENLYFVGDILNIDRPSGGYSLQLCWSTGFVAGDSAGSYVRNQ